MAAYPDREREPPAQTSAGLISSPTFRVDINGLRAWAVGLVVLYHFEVPGFSGGFLGVDVFFVVSGYLMAGILLGSQPAPSLASFWLARATRIVPALSVLIATVIAVGWFALPVPEYRLLAQHSIASLGFVSNHQYLAEAGYFDISAHDKWLLHTWSLSVEAQFYLLFPLLLAGLRRWAPTCLFETLVLLTTLSWLACVLVTPVEPSRAFYLLPFRVWELLAGACLCLWRRRPMPWVGRSLEFVGVFLLLACAFCLTPSSAWPGALASLPVLGALMIIASGHSTRLTSHPIAQWLGERSYSIYLWHWPIVVALGFLPSEDPALPTVAGIALSIFFGAVSHRFLERPRLPGAAAHRTLALAAILAMPLALSVSVVSWQGFPGRVPVEAEVAAREAWNRGGPGIECREDVGAPGKFCSLGEGPLAAVLVGDSHADAIAGALSEAAGPDHSVQSWTYPSCLMLLGAQVVPGVLRSGERCTEFTDEVRRRVSALPPGVPIVIASRISAYVDGRTEPGRVSEGRPALHFGTPRASADGIFGEELADAFSRTACELGRARRIFLMAPVPEMPVDVPRAVSRALVLGVERYPSLSEQDYKSRHRLALAALGRAVQDCGAVVLDPRPLLCSAGRCRSTEGQRPLYYDDDHLSEFGSRRLLPMLAPVFAH
ncbi:MAG: acyltransferase family protein [Aquimonas sp.]|jgi:peptidoglycan/LPS O-acetylase OafA/YrhL